MPAAAAGSCCLAARAVTPAGLCRHLSSSATVRSPHPRAKFAELCTKERELEAFFDAFPARREAKRQEIRGCQDGVAAALERLAQQRTAAAGAAGAAAGGGAAAAAPASPEDLAAELVACRAELARIEGLEAKVSEELAAMAQRREDAEAEAAGLSAGDVARAAGGARARADELQGRRDELAGARDAAQVRGGRRACGWWWVACLAEALARGSLSNSSHPLVRHAQADLAAARAAASEHEAALQRHPAWPAIAASEQQLAGLRRALEGARRAAAARRAEADCSPLAAGVVELVRGVNARLLLAAGAAQPVLR
jgi:outer membrane murein-binding lipoprotein Lpp